VNIADGGTGFERVAANTRHDCPLVIGVNSFLHYILQDPGNELRKDTKIPIELQYAATLF
jgi:hypothetical protein